ncbi:VOC family protein [Devosia rhizoryzae]|uniref:VOC family protein n=1 Tax=Devosia rhizoryzae TaxID=2774137 RepID=A0ABX7CCS7_9HYPH|nr:VOC family protein [Devosia rhizoryzae]QQR40420.1 VOC family protein [Devosia rhizoryzae]
MAITTTTHLNFRSQARDALSYYQSVFGGEISLFTYEQAQRVKSPAENELITWGQVLSDAGFHVMAYDVQPERDWAPGRIPFFVSVRGKVAAEIQGYWDKLVEGSTIVEPIGPAGWSPLYGMVKDRFGVTWVLDVEVAYAG